MNIFKPVSTIEHPNSYFKSREAINPQIAGRIGLIYLSPEKCLSLSVTTRQSLASAMAAR
jgi:hypothetical protein